MRFETSAIPLDMIIKILFEKDFECKLALFKIRWNGKQISQRNKLHIFV